MTAVCLLAAFVCGDDAPAKATPLFNGKDLTGWTKIHDGKYEVEDGKLVLSSGNGWLRTDKEYANFDLVFEWRTEAKYRTGGQYDSGVFFRTGLDGKPWPKNKYQFNLKQGDDGNLPGIANKGFPNLVNPPGEWNTFRVRCVGTEAEGWINGKPAWKTDKIKAAKGYIGLQAEGHRFEFRKIELRQLD